MSFDMKPGMLLIDDNEVYDKYRYVIVVGIVGDYIPEFIYLLRDGTLITMHNNLLKHGWSKA